VPAGGVWAGPADQRHLQVEPDLLADGWLRRVEEAVREFETEVDTRLAEAETALFEARESGDRAHVRRVAAAFRRAADAMERFAIGDLAYEAEELRRLAADWEKGYPDAATFDSTGATVREIFTRVVDAGRPSELGAPESE
jgi:hypothetical protein